VLIWFVTYEAMLTKLEADYIINISQALESGFTKK
jgi:hypothetical protein